MARTRQQIQNEINQHQRYISRCNQSKSNYNNSLNYAKKMLSGLNASLQSLNTANDDLRKYFSIGGRAADAGAVEKLRDEVQAAIKDVNNKLIPELNSGIKALNSAINYRNSEISKLRRELQQATE